MPKYTRNLETVREHFDRDALTEICQMHELDFGKAFDLDEYEVPAQKAPDNYYYFRDNGASVLAVAHLDTVVYHDQRTTRFYETNDGLVVHSGALDDRLGAYTILDLLPKCGIEYDILLTVGEESGQSTAMYFDADKDYDWIIEFDRGGTDVVMYQYDDEATRAAVRRTGARVGDGIFSDISYMEHVGVKGFNWGVGYQDYHSTRGHAYIDDYLSMIARYLKFHQQNAGTAMPHDETKVPDSWWGGFGKGRNDDPWWNEDDEFLKHNAHDHTDEEIDNYQRAGLWDMSDHRTGYHGHGFDPVDDDPYYSEGVYTDDEYIEDPTIEEIQAALERMDDEDAKWAAIMEGRAS